MSASYRVPGAPPSPPPEPQPNAYLQPGGPPPQISGHQPALRQPEPPPQAAEFEPPSPQVCAPAAHRALLAEWRRHHGADWVRADALAPEVRRMIDTRERLPAIRQKLRQIVATYHELETKVVGNAARPVAHYRLAGLEG